MKTLKNSKRKFRPKILGLLLLLVACVGCEDSSIDVAQGSETTQTQALARTSEEEEPPVGEDFETLDSAILARAADVFPANIRMGSTTAAGVSANGHSYEASLSEDGRYLSFASKASNLSDMPINNQYQVYRKDLETGELVCVSRAGSWAPPADGRSHYPRISDDGGKVVFSSQASNLVYLQSASSGVDNVYLAEFPLPYPGAPTGDYQLKLLTPSQNGGWGQPETPANGASLVREFAGNRFIAFKSKATDLHWDDQDTRWDLYRYDAETNQNWSPPLTLLSITNSHVKGNGDALNIGLLAAEESGYLTTMASNMAPSGHPRPSLQKLESWSISPMAPESKKYYDVDVAEQSMGKLAVTVRNAANTGFESYYYRFEYPGQANPVSVKLADFCRQSDSFDISDDGRFVVYEDQTQRSDLGDNDSNYDIFVYDAETDTHTLVTKSGPSNAHAYRPVISDDGSTIAWDQGGRVYLTGNPVLGSAPPAQAQLVSATQSGTHANSGWNGVRNPSISSDSRFLTFESKATNLHPDATSGKNHIYFKDLSTGELSLVSRRSSDNAAAEASGESFIGEDGKTVIFSSPREDIGHETVPANNFSTTYVRDMEQGETKFLFTKGRILDFGIHPYVPDSLRLFFSSYGSQNDHYNGTAPGVYEAEYPNFYPYPIPMIPSWMLDQYLLQDLKVSDDGQTTLAAFTDSSVSPTRTLLYRFRPGSYGANSELITEFLDFQHFDMSADGLTVAYTERLGGDWTQKMLVLRDYGAGYYYSNYQSYYVTSTQATYPHLSDDGRYLLYYDSNYPLGQSSGSGDNVYVFDKETQESLPVREDSISYPGSLRLSADGRSVIFEDYDYETGSQLYFIKNPHPVGESNDPYGY